MINLALEWNDSAPPATGNPGKVNNRTPLSDRDNHNFLQLYSINYAIDTRDQAALAASLTPLKENILRARSNRDMFLMTSAQSDLALVNALLDQQ